MVTNSQKINMLNGKITVVDQNMEKYYEDDINYSITCRLETTFHQSKILCFCTDVGSIKGKHRFP